MTEPIQSKAGPPAAVALTVVVPALNEEANIPGLLRATAAALERLAVAWEVIVVDDGSTDRTGEKVRAFMASEPRVRMLRHEKPGGIGGAFWAGVREAKGEFLTFLPGDHENEPEEILRYYGLLKDVDFVVPFVFDMSNRPWFRSCLSRLFTLIINTSFGVKFNYTNGTVLYRRSLLLELNHQSAGFLFTTDIVVRLARRGYLFAEVPYRLRDRAAGASKATSLKSLRRVISEYLRLMADCYVQGTPATPLASDAVSARRRRELESAALPAGIASTPK